MAITIDQVISVVVGILGALSAVIYKNLTKAQESEKTERKEDVSRLSTELEKAFSQIGEAQKIMAEQKNSHTETKIELRFIAEANKSIQTDVAAIRVDIAAIRKGKD